MTAASFRPPRRMQDLSSGHSGKPNPQTLITGKLPPGAQEISHTGMTWARHRASLAVQVQPCLQAPMLGVTSNPGCNDRTGRPDQQVLNHPACALSASALTRMAAKNAWYRKGRDQTPMP